MTTQKAHNVKLLERDCMLRAEGLIFPHIRISSLGEKSSAGAWRSHKNYYLCSWSHTPPATQSSKGKEPHKFGLRTRVLHFSENIGHLK